MKFHRTSLLLVVLITVITSHSSGNVEFSLSAEVAKEGETLTAICNVSSSNSFIIWEKKTTDGHLVVEMATKHFVNDDFKNTGRYSASVYPEDQGDASQFQYTLTISGLQSEDSGWITCKPGGTVAKPESYKLFTVQVPVKKIWWTTKGGHLKLYNGQSVSLKEDDVQQFLCHVNGSYPKADVKVFLGDEDITHLFTVKGSLKKGNGTRGLRPLYYHTEAVSISTIIGYRNMTKALKCVATLPDSDTPPNQASIRVNLTEYRPEFLCDNKMQARLHDQYFNLTCKVHASPTIKDIKFLWISDDDNDNDTLEVGKQTVDMVANTTDGETKDEVIMVMTIYRVSTKHFQRKYIFEAENNVSRVIHVIQLEQDESPISNSHSVPGSSVKVVLELLLLLLPLSALQSHSCM